MAECRLNVPPFARGKFSLYVLEKCIYFFIYKMNHFESINSISIRLKVVQTI